MPLTQAQKRALEAKLREYVGETTGPPQRARDAVNQAMIRHWCDAMGDANPAYTDAAAAAASVHGGIIAPPTMLQAWILPGIEMASELDEPRDKQQELHRLLTEHGYSSVVATNCEQGYTRYLRPGDEISAETVVESISEEKATALGIGYFIDTHTRFTDQKGEEVGWMKFRVLKFIPEQRPQAAAADDAAPAKPQRIRPPKGHDNAWWWDIVDRGELPIQKCNVCGALHHPPRPMCGTCQSTDLGHVVASGRGEVYSYVVMHHP
ncbi:MAG: MaoC family dehydratase N-terminal domain-containing protein, partial [Thermoanaerobaculia bacterium]|nr:MaoC family dehydratase N-terminal domain-containing protein [Thermoanaerobaculia bacterium]